MHDPVVVAEGDGGEELEHEGFDLRGEEGGRHGREKGFEVMLNEVHDDEDSAKEGVRFIHPEGKAESSLRESLADDDLAHAHDVLMAGRHERLDLAQAGDGETVLLLLHLELLERDDGAGRLAAGAKDDAVAAFLDLVEAL